MSETDTQVRLRRAKEALASARTKEIELIKLLNEARQSVTRAKEKYEALFVQEGKEECARRMKTYSHCTK